MKKYFLLLIALTVTHSAVQADVKPRFFISTSAAGDSSGTLAAAYVAYFETQVFDLIKQIYPCADINSLSTVTALLDLERQKQLLGSGTDNAFNNIAQSLGCDYLISLKVSVINNTALVSALCMDNKKAKTLSRAFANAQHGDAGLDAVVKVSKELFDGLKQYEICPFKGPVTVHIVSTRKDKQKEEHAVYCNRTDGVYRKTTSIDKYSENDWAIEKTGKNSAKGDVTFNLSEETTIEEDNPCYECSSKKQGPRSYFEKRTTYSKLQGLSNESESNGTRVDDARVYITFLDDGTYTLRVKAASTQGEKRTKKDVHAEGVCDNIKSKPETVTSKVDEGINETFGPFAGTAQDKVLSQKDTIKRSDPNTKEESTITYEFTLTRE